MNQGVNVLLGFDVQGNNPIDERISHANRETLPQYLRRVPLQKRFYGLEFFCWSDETGGHLQKYIFRKSLAVPELVGIGSMYLNTLHSEKLTPAKEFIQNEIALHKISKTGSYEDLNDVPSNNDFTSYTKTNTFKLNGSIPMLLNDNQEYTINSITYINGIPIKPNDDGEVNKYISTIVTEAYPYYNDYTVGEKIVLGTIDGFSSMYTRTVGVSPEWADSGTKKVIGVHYIIKANAKTFIPVFGDVLHLWCFNMDVMALEGYTFTPSYNDETGILSWTNDGGLPNPDPVKIKGEDGAKGDPGENGYTNIIISPTEPSDHRKGTIWIKSSQ